MQNSKWFETAKFESNYAVIKSCIYIFILYNIYKLNKETGHFWKLLIYASASSKFVDGRISGNCVSDYVFNLRQKISSPSKIKVLEKGLGFLRHIH